MGTLTNLNDVKRALSIGSNVDGTLVFDKNLDDTQIALDIQRASDFFATETQNNYYGAIGTLTLDVSEQYIRGRQLFFRHDVLRSITRIENDGNGTLTSSDWVTMPRNSTPYFGVELKTKYWQWSTSPLGAIRVIGALGENADGQPSAQVHLAVTRLASWLYKTRDTRGNIQLSTGNNATANEGFPDVVREIIENEKRHRLYA